MEEKKPEQTPSESSHDVGLEEESGVVNEKALIRKLDFRLLPAVTVLYLMSFLDRSNGADYRYQDSSRWKC
jgi:hypothetical protein